MGGALLEVEAAQIHFPVRRGLLQRPSAWVKALDGVSLSVDAGDSLGVVGESGSGKTTLASGIAMLEPLTAGRISFGGRDLSLLDARERRKTRRSIQFVFQDPFWSLDPRWQVRDIVGEPLKVHEHLRGDAYQDAVVEALEMVGLGGADLFKYPHEFAGGVRQRIAIARALSIKPELVLLDEPTSSVDVLSQHQILLMLQALKERLELTLILVSHDLSVVGYLASKIAVMYAGRLFEYGPAEAIIDRPLHPYTRALFGSAPNPNVFGVDSLTSLSGGVPSALNPPPGCRFHPRCPHVMPICSVEEPPRLPEAGDHYAFCWLLSEGASC